MEIDIVTDRTLPWYASHMLTECKNWEPIRCTIRIGLAETDNPNIPLLILCHELGHALDWHYKTVEERRESQAIRLLARRYKDEKALKGLAREEAKAWKYALVLVKMFGLPITIADIGYVLAYLLQLSKQAHSDYPGFLLQALSQEAKELANW